MAYEFNHYYELQNVQTRKHVNILGNHEDGTVKNGKTVNLVWSYRQSRPALGAGKLRRYASLYLAAPCGWYPL